jgi:hypothetical protein
MAYNILTCEGFTETAAGWVAGGSCLKSRIGLVLLFFIIAVIRKWGGEEIGLGFSFILALLGGIFGYLIVIIIFGSFKIAMAVGLIAALVLGYGGGTIFGDSGGGDY